jgi:hypothetical protein
MEADGRRKIKSREAVEGAEGGAVPEAAKFGGGLGEFVDAANGGKG